MKALTDDWQVAANNINNVFLIFSDLIRLIMTTINILNVYFPCPSCPVFPLPASITSSIPLRVYRMKRFINFPIRKYEFRNSFIIFINGKSSRSIRQEFEQASQYCQVFQSYDHLALVGKR